MNPYSDSDLATERCRGVAASVKGIEKEEHTENGVAVHTVKIVSEEASEAVGKPRGTYITVEYDRDFKSISSYETAVKVLQDAVRTLLPKTGKGIFCVGLGNPSLTSDAFGPSVTDSLVVTHHIMQADRRLFDSLRLSDVSALCPGVLGQTGIESAEIIAATVQRIQPAVVVLTDALAARDKKRLCSTVQISDTGITPGSGIGNRRLALCEETLGVPVLSLGVPTVIRASALCEGCPRERDGSDLIVTPKDINVYVTRAARLTAEALNGVFHPFLTKEEAALLKA